MQLQLKREEKKVGLFVKKSEYIVKTQLLVSEEERMAIKTLDMEKMTIVEPYECKKLPQGERKIAPWADSGILFLCDNIPQAVGVEEEIKEAAKQVKDAVTNFIESGAKTEMEEVFDL